MTARLRPVGRIGRGWQLSRESWAIIKADRSLLVFPVFAGIGSLIAVIVFGGAGAGLATTSAPLAIVVAVIGLYVVIAFALFCNVALTACAARSLEGVDTRPSEGWAVARERLGVILGWALLQLVVGAAITAIQALLREGAGQLVGSLVGGLANFAWTVATFFVVPVIALEGLGPRAALGRSTAVIRERWGEGVTGSFAIGGIVFLLAFLPGAVLVFAGIGVAGAFGAVLVVLGIAVFLVGAVIQTALMTVFKVALYRFATENRVVGRFERPQLEAAFRPRGRAARAGI
jgi:Family of unknown function (DUF6159)